MEDNVMKRIARPQRRSPLFWWLFDHYDEMRAAAAEGGLGIPWSVLVGDFAAMGITDANGRPVKPGTAKTTWQRVHKAVKRGMLRDRQSEAE
jgi:hypothetical protein